MRLVFPAAVVLSFVLIAGACSDTQTASPRAPAASPSPSPSAGSGSFGATTPQAGVPSGPTAVVRRASLALRSDSRAYPRGAQVSFVMELANVGQVTLALNFATSQRFEIEVVDGSGAVIWKWSEGKVFSQATATIELAPGNSQKFDATWDQRDRGGKQAPDGKYVARAWLLSPGPQLQGTANFTIGQ